MNSAERQQDMTPVGLPHSEISGSTPACDSPELFAANHVLHRLLTPRHSPCALSSLVTNRLWNPGRVPHLRRSLWSAKPPVARSLVRVALFGDPRMFSASLLSLSRYAVYKVESGSLLNFNS